MNENRFHRAWRLSALSAASIAPFAAACGSSNPPPTSVTNPSSTAAMQPQTGYPAATTPPGYPGSTAAYPAATAPGAYPTATAGYPPPPAGYPTAQAGYPPVYPAATAPGAAPTASAPPGPLAPVDPNSLQSILGGLQGALQGTLVAPGGAVDLTEMGLKAQALRLAPGMQAEGPELKQSLPEGQHAVMMVTLQAGKCYSIIGFSPVGGVKDLDLNLLAPPLYMTLAGQDLTHNNMPVIGASPSPMCPVIAFPLQYKLDVFARSGTGEVAVQLYSKSK